MAAQRPFFVIVPGASHSPAAYGYLSHLLMLAGYPVWSALLPSVGRGEFTAEDDAKYVREAMLLPVLDEEKHDVILIMHSYSSIPGTAACAGLGKAERAAQGKKGVIAQIFISSFLTPGGTSGTAIDSVGGHYPPHIRADIPANLLRCDDRIPPLYADIQNATLKEAAGVSAMAQGLVSFNSPVPRATWDSEAFKGRIAFVRTLKDAAVPLHIQQMMIDGTGVEWKISDIDAGHSPQLSKPEELRDVLVGLAVEFEGMEN